MKPARIALAVLAGGALGFGGCGGGDDRSLGHGMLAWAKPPVLLRATNRATDRVLIGTVRNTSLRRIDLVAARLRVRDARGLGVAASVSFAAGYAHGLYGAYQRPSTLPEEELRRLGMIVRIDPGKIAPLAVAFRLRAGLRLPLQIEYGRGLLPVPPRAR